MNKIQCFLISIITVLLCSCEKQVVTPPVQRPQAAVQAYEELPQAANVPIKEEEKPKEAPVPKGYTMTAHELAVLDAILTDDMEMFKRGNIDNTSIRWGDLPIVQVSEVAKVYEENQVAGDLKYFDKQLLVLGKVSSINSGIGNEPYVGMMGGSDMFLTPQIHFKNGKQDIEKIANLKKGQAVSFVCYGGGSIAGSVMFKQCEFGDDYLAGKKNSILTDIKTYLTGGAASQEDKFLSITGIASAKIVPESAICSTPKEIMKCLRDESFKGNAIFAEMIIAYKNLTSLGIDVTNGLKLLNASDDRMKKYMEMTDDQIRNYVKEVASKNTKQDKKAVKNQKG